MNLLDILSAGKRPLSEENVSSFLAWLLDPSQSHGCGPIFLKRVLQLIDESKFAPWIAGLVNTVAYREPNQMNVQVLVEDAVKRAEGKERHVDIVILLINGTDIPYILAIENKIREASYDTAQLGEEYEGVREVYNKAAVSVLYLTPSKSRRFLEAFNLLPADVPKLHMSWTKTKAFPNEVAFVDILREVLQNDANATIDPLSQEVKFVLKSFIMFAENGFQSQTSRGTSLVAPSPYYKGIVIGLEGLKVLFEKQKDAYIGFVGGIRALQSADLTQLENRFFKWDDNKKAGKIESNWIPGSKFSEILREKGLTL